MLPPAGGMGRLIISGGTDGIRRSQNDAARTCKARKPRKAYTPEIRRYFR